MQPLPSNLTECFVAGQAAMATENRSSRLSPARVASAITVGATSGTSTTNSRWVAVPNQAGNTYGSNYGADVDIFTPGENVRVATPGTRFGSAAQAVLLLQLVMPDRTIATPT